MKKKKTTKKKPKNRREAVKHAGLKKQYNLKSRQDLVEVDYLDKLSEKEKDFLNRFNEEYVNANFNHGGKILHKTKKLKKDCYDKNNSRNRCSYTKAKAQGELVEFGDFRKLKEDYFDLNMMEARELLEDFDNLNNGLDSAKKSKNPTKKKH